MFSDSNKDSPMSAHRANCYEHPTEANKPGCALVRLSARFVRGLGLRIATEPPVPDDPGHLWIGGAKRTSRKKKLARRAKWVIPPEEESQAFFSSRQTDHSPPA